MLALATAEQKPLLGRIAAGGALPVVGLGTLGRPQSVGPCNAVAVAVLRVVGHSWARVWYAGGAGGGAVQGYCATCHVSSGAAWFTGLCGNLPLAPLFQVRRCACVGFGGVFWSIVCGAAHCCLVQLCRVSGVRFRFFVIVGRPVAAAEAAKCMRGEHGHVTYGTWHEAAG